MRAMTLRGGELAICEIDRPIPGPGQILVRTLACAICASDHYMDHPEVSRADRSGMRVDAPDEHVVMGHEYCGEIVEYGPDTRREWPVDSRITATPALFGAGGLRIIGMAPDAPGAFGEYFLVTEGFARPVPDTIPPEQLALIDAMAVGWYYTDAGTADTGSVPLFIGLGAIGLSVVVALKQRGAHPIVAADLNPEGRSLAADLGADVVVDPRRTPTFAAWRRHAWNTDEDIHDRIRLAGLPRCVVYECTGAPGMLGSVVDECPLGTRIFTAGGSASDTIPTEVAHIKGVNIQFGGGPMPEHWFEMCDLVATGAVDTAPPDRRDRRLRRTHRRLHPGPTTRCPTADRVPAGSLIIALTCTNIPALGRAGRPLLFCLDYLQNKEASMPDNHRNHIPEPGLTATATTSDIARLVYPARSWWGRLADRAADVVEDRYLRRARRTLDATLLREAADLNA